MSHTDDGTMHAYLDGELSAREAVELEQHVAGCSDCRARLEEARALIKRAGSLLALAAPAARVAPPWPPATAALGRWRRHGVPLAWAATVVLALGTAWYVGRRTLPGERSTPTPPTAALRRQAEAPAPTPPPAPVVSPQAPASSAAAAVPSPAAGRPRVDTAVAPVLVRERAAESRMDLSPWVELGFDGAGTLLGQPPLAIPGLSIRRLARPRTGEALVLVEQLVDSGTVVRLYEQRRPGPAADSLPQRGLVASGAAPARVGRDAGPLRVEIEGPLPPDSLRRLLERVK
jgi:anti-sigma factor RsiW